MAANLGDLLASLARIRAMGAPAPVVAAPDPQGPTPDNAGGGLFSGPGGNGAPAGLFAAPPPDAGPGPQIAPWAAEAPAAAPANDPEPVPAPQANGSIGPGVGSSVDSRFAASTPNIPPMAQPDIAQPSPIANAPQLPQAPHINPVLGVLDRLFLGGSVEGIEGLNYKRAMDNVVQQRLADALARAPQSERDALTLGGAEAQKNFAPNNLSEGQTGVMWGDRSNPIYAPKTEIEPVSGRPIVMSPRGYTAGPTLGGGFTTTAEGETNSRTGDFRGLSKPFSAPKTDNVYPFTPQLTGEPPAGAPLLPSPGTATVDTNGNAVPPPPSAGPPGNLSGFAAHVLARPSVAALPPGDQATLLATGLAESGLNPNARNNGSSTGVYQFHPDTFAALGGTNINDPNQQIDAAAALQLQNKAALSQVLGRDPTPAELYLAHQQGIKGATALLTAPPGANAVGALVAAGIGPTVARRSITGNAGSVNATASGFAQMWSGRFGKLLNKVGQVGAGPGASSAPAPQDPTGSPGGGFGAPIQTGKSERIVTADQVSNGKPGWTYKIGADDSITPIPPIWTPDMVSKRGSEFMNSKDYEEANSSLNAVNGLWNVIGSVAPNGVIDNAAFDTFQKAINPGLGVRSTTMDMFMQHLGLPQEVQSKYLSTFGHGYLTQDTLKNMTRVAWSYANSHVGTLKNHAAGDAKWASEHGYKPDDLGETVPDMPTVPAFARDAPPPPQALKPGMVFWSAKGPAKWTGKGWVLGE